MYVHVGPCGARRRTLSPEAGVTDGELPIHPMWVLGIKLKFFRMDPKELFSL